MKVDQTIAGALTDFVSTAKRSSGFDPEFTAELEVFLREWAADRGLDLDQAEVAGWQGELGKEIGSRYAPSYEERIRSRYGDMKGPRR